MEYLRHIKKIKEKIEKSIVFKIYIYISLICWCYKISQCITNEKELNLGLLLVVCLFLFPVCYEIKLDKRYWSFTSNFYLSYISKSHFNNGCVIDCIRLIKNDGKSLIYSLMESNLSIFGILTSIFLVTLSGDKMKNIPYWNYGLCSCMALVVFVSIFIFSRRIFLNYQHEIIKSKSSSSLNKMWESLNIRCQTIYMQILEIEMYKRQIRAIEDSIEYLSIFNLFECLKRNNSDIDFNLITDNMFSSKQIIAEEFGKKRYCSDSPSLYF